MRERALLAVSAFMVGFFIQIHSALALNNIMIWPIDPWIGGKDKATELWVQNESSKPTIMQVRVLRWWQEEGKERYQQQQDVVASPPIVRIDGGTKQLIRLIKQTQLPATAEQSYRVIIDEIPQPDADNAPKIGLKLQMRFSIPLFVYGPEVKVKKSNALPVSVNPQDLHWQIVRDNGKPALQITNQGNVHVRLTDVSLQQGGKQHTITKGLMGYVLPGQTRQWLLPAGLTHPTQLTATINSRESVWHATAVN